VTVTAITSVYFITPVLKLFGNKNIDTWPQWS